MRRTANRRRLKNYIIANKTHFRMMIANLIHTTLVVFVFTYGVLGLFYHYISLTDEIHFQNYSAKFFLILLDRLPIALLVILLFAFLYQVMISQKFCGPLQNFSNTFKKVTQGDLTRKIYLRRYDFLKNEAAEVNDMIDFLSDHIMTIKKDHNLLMAMLEDVTAGETAPTEYQKTLETLKKQVDICHKHVSVFKIDGKSD